MRIGQEGEKVTLFSILSGKPFQVVAYNYPYGDLPHLPDNELKELSQKDYNQLTVLEKCLLTATYSRASRKKRYFQEQTEKQFEKFCSIAFE